MTTDTAETAVALRPSGRLELRDDQDFWSAEQVAALKVLGIKDATNGDLSVFFHYCRRTQLDPFSRQIYMINRRNKERYQDERGQWQEQWVTKQTIQVGIDGFRVIRDRAAERTGYFVEFEDTVWYDAEGGEHTVWLSAEPPTACRVVLVKRSRGLISAVLRFPAVLRTAAYAATTSNGTWMAQWKTQPEHMIEKCCEAFATRRAFPHDLGGVYIEEEMHEGTGIAPPPAARRVTRAEVLRTEPAPAPDPVPEATAAQVNAEFRRLGYKAADAPQVMTIASSLAGRRANPAHELKDMTGPELGRIRDALAACPDEAALAELLERLGGEESGGDGDG